MDSRRALSDITNISSIHTPRIKGTIMKPTTIKTPATFVYEDPIIDPDREMTQLFEELGELHNQNEKMIKKYNIQKMNVHKLQEHIESQNSQIEEFETIIKELRNQLTDMDHKLRSEKSAISSENEEKIRLLSEKVIQLNEKLKQEEESKSKLESLVRTKDTKLRDQSEKLQKLSTADERSTKKTQESLKQRELSLQKLTKDLEKEKKLRLDTEKKYSLLEDQVETLQTKLSSSVEDNDSTTKLLDLMEAKLKRAVETKESFQEKLKIEESKREEEGKELCSLREEMTKICETALAEKQHSEELETELEELRMEHQKAIRELQDLRSSEKIAKLETDKISEVKRHLELLLSQKVEEYDSSVAELAEKIQSLEKECQSFKQAVSEKDLEVVEAKRREDELRLKLNTYAQKLQKELDSKKSLAESLEKKDVELNLVQERRIALQKRIDKDSRIAKKAIEEKEKFEGAFTKMKTQLHDLENKFSKKEKEHEKLLQKHALLQEEFDKEKVKGERTWSELEESMKLLKQVQNEKGAIEKAAKHAHEVLEMKMNNKLTMLEKKCEYLKRMNDFACRDSNQEGLPEEYMKEQQERILQLMTDHEELSEALGNVETHLIAKERELDLSNEKIRQLEDLLNTQHRKKTSELKGVKNDLPKKILILEKSLDEVLLEVGAEGIQPSKMNPREKALVIVGKLQENKKELTRLLVDRNILNEEISKLKQDLDDQFSKAQENLEPTIVEKIVEVNNNTQYDDLQAKYNQLYEQCQKYKSWVLKFTSNLKGRRMEGSQNDSDSSDDECSVSQQRIQLHVYPMTGQ